MIDLFNAFAAGVAFMGVIAGAMDQRAGYTVVCALLFAVNAALALT